MTRILLIAAILAITSSCDLFPFPPDVCPAIAIDCDVGMVPVDANGDGCEDSCAEVPCFGDDDCGVNQICEPENAAAFAPAFSGVCVNVCNDQNAVREACEDGAELIDTDGDGCVDSCPEFRACSDSFDCQSDEVCDTQNFCESDPACNDSEPDLACADVCFGRCVAVNECPEIAPICDDGFVPADTNGDGCVDGCAPATCPPEFFDCDEGQSAVDTSGDGCLDSCEPVVCTDIEIQCNEGTFPADTTGDGCENDCVQCPEPTPPTCDEGERVVSDGQCEYSCEPVACPEIALPTCEEGEQLVDSDGDGCLDSCQPVICLFDVACNDDSFPVDTDGDGCADTCFAIDCPAVEPVCEDGQVPGDADGNGCNDDCVDAEACLALPSCDAGDRLIESTSECLADGRCYTVSVCGSTILCTGG